MTHQWQIVATVIVKQQTGGRGSVAASACLIVGTNERDPQLLSDQELVTTYNEQGGVERGFRLLRISVVPDLLGHSLETGAHHRASRVIMVLCLLVYRLAECRLRARLAETEQTIPDQVGKPTARPTMRLSSFNASRVLSCCMCRPYHFTHHRVTS